MNIAIAGAGIARGYLVKPLGQKGISPDFYDGMGHDLPGAGVARAGGGFPVASNHTLRRSGSISMTTFLNPCHR